jgi:hypothetical protein
MEMVLLGSVGLEAKKYPSPEQIFADLSSSSKRETSRKIWLDICRTCSHALV